VLKPHLEFVSLDLNEGWSIPPGYPEGIEEKVLCGALSPETGTGCRTRLLRFAAGIYTTAPFVHEYWEEVYLVHGDLTVGNDHLGQGGTSFGPDTYACRPPGAAACSSKSTTTRKSVLWRRHRHRPLSLNKGVL